MWLASSPPHLDGKPQVFQEVRTSHLEIPQDHFSAPWNPGVTKMLVRVTYPWVHWHWLEPHLMCQGSPRFFQCLEGFLGEKGRLCPFWPRALCLLNLITVHFWEPQKWLPVSYCLTQTLDWLFCHHFTDTNSHADTTYRRLCLWVTSFIGMLVKIKEN